MLVGPKAVCSGCHEPGTPGAKTAAQMAGWIDNLDTSLRHSEAVLDTKPISTGMEVSEAQVRIGDGHEDLIKARLALHSMRPEEMHKPVEAGMAIAGETLRAGQAALHDKDVRRLGLAISVFFIALTVAAVWLLIRRLEANGSGYVEPTK